MSLVARSPESTGAAPAAAAAAAALARSAGDEWSDLVAAAVLGTDRRPAPDPRPGWDAWARAGDPAVALLDRAAAVVVARRAGACPAPPPEVTVAPAPPDRRPPCPPACAARLGRLLAGEHDELLPEWFERVAAAGVQLPWALLPALASRGRRHPALDAVVRELSAGRVAWLADVMPELGVRATAVAVPGSAPPLAPPPRPPDSAAVVTAIVSAFHERAATWNTARELRLAVAAIDPQWLPALVAELSRLAFDPVVERTRGEVLAAAEFRHAMLLEFAAVTPADPAGSPDPAGRVDPQLPAARTRPSDPHVLPAIRPRPHGDPT